MTGVWALDPRKPSGERARRCPRRCGASEKTRRRRAERVGLRVPARSEERMSGAAGTAANDDRAVTNGRQRTVRNQRVETHRSRGRGSREHRTKGPSRPCTTLRSARRVDVCKKPSRPKRTMTFGPSFLPTPDAFADGEWNPRPRRTWRGALARHRVTDRKSVV